MRARHLHAYGRCHCKQHQHHPKTCLPHSYNSLLCIFLIIFIDGKYNKAVLKPRVSPAFAITFTIIVILDLKIHQSMWIHWPFFPKTWTKGHWPLDDLWPHVCWGHMCDSIQGSLCPSPMTIHQCMWIQWSILQITTYIHTHTMYILHTSDIRTEWVIT